MQYAVQVALVIAFWMTESFVIGIIWLCSTFLFSLVNVVNKITALENRALRSGRGQNSAGAGLKVAGAGLKSAMITILALLSGAIVGMSIRWLLGGRPE